MAAIVLVDDHVLLRNGLSAIVKSLGHTVIFEADNGHDFCKKLDPALLPDIILMDINMPRMSVMEVISALKANLDHRHLPILVVSTATDTRLIDKIITNGASGYFAKPGNLEEIQQLALNIKDFYVKHYPSVN
jgi:DNA-binding NarL/FixJ family response regulator